MAGQYTRNTWVNGAPPAINDTNLNNVETGVESASRYSRSVVATPSTDADYTLTAAENQYGRIEIDTTNWTTGRNVIMNSNEHTFLAVVTGGQSVTFKNATGVGVIVASGEAKKLRNDTINIINFETFSGSFGFKNLIINGDKRVNQRSYADTVLADGEYGYDRWKGANSNVNIEQVIEQQNIETEVYTISWVGGGTATVNGVGGLSSGDSLTVTVTGDVSVVVPKGATKVQLEKGSVATPFEQRPYGLELSLCQRYYESFTGKIVTSNRLYGTSSSRAVSPSFKVKKRAVPTITFTPSGQFASTSLNAVGENDFTVNGTASSGAAGTSIDAFTADAEL